MLIKFSTFINFSTHTHHLVKFLLIILITKSCIATNFAFEDKDKNDIYKYDISYELYMCNDTDQNSKAYCTCNEAVVSCDFSNYPNPSSSKKKTHMNLIASWNMDSIKRICICGTPNNLEVEITNKFLLDNHGVNRIDIYNMDGAINVPLDFRINFSGDIYIAKIKFLREMAAWAFGRGYTIDLVDTEGLKCCSKIKSLKLSSPVFFMEDTTIGIIQNDGINSQHLWNTIVFNRVTFQKMNSYAIKLDKYGQLNASFTNCKFQNLEKSSIVINGIVNFLIAHSLFEESCHPGAIGARADGDATTVALIGNTFLGSNILEVDGQNVFIWFNKFSIWNNNTFAHIATAPISGDQHVISIEFNLVDKFLLTVDSIPQIINLYTVIINENIVSNCDCETVSQLKLPFLMTNTTNRCETNSTSVHCFLSILNMQSECTRTNSLDVVKLCNEDKGSTLNWIVLNTQLVDKKLEYSNIHIKSAFINDMLIFVKNSIGINEIKYVMGANITDITEEKNRMSKKFLSKILFVVTMFLYIC